MKNDGTIHIAYAEDHPVTREGTIYLLDAFDDITIDFTAGNGKEMIAMLEQAETLPDICMLDVQMPVMDGFQTIAKIRKRWPAIKCLAVSAFEDEGYVLRMIQSGANGYLSKATNIDKMHDALVSIHRQGYYYSEVADSKLFHMAHTESRKIPPLSDLEVGLLKLCCTEYTYVEMIKLLDSTRYGVEGCRNRLYDKLHVKSKIGLALFAIQFGFVQLPQSPFMQSDSRENNN